MASWTIFASLIATAAAPGAMGGSAAAPGAMGGFRDHDPQDFGPSTHAHRLAEFCLRGLQGSATPPTKLQGALLQRVVGWRSQVVAGTNHEIVAETSAGKLTLKIYEQVWTNTLKVTSAVLVSPVSQISMALITTPLVDEEGEALLLDGVAFNALEAQCVPNPSAICTAEYQPVCGNGKTYSNRCRARAMCQQEVTEGECASPPAEQKPTPIASTLHSALLLGGAPISGPGFGGHYSGEVGTKESESAGAPALPSKQSKAPLVTCPSVCTPNPTETCFHDPACEDPHSPLHRGGLGCNAGGKGQHCRFCGFGDFVACPAEEGLGFGQPPAELPDDLPPRPMLDPILSPQPNGEDVCEGHGYGQEECELMGCCQFAACPDGSGRGACHSNVGDGACTPTPFSSHFETTAACGGGYRHMHFGGGSMIFVAAFVGVIYARRLRRARAATPTVPAVTTVTVTGVPMHEGLRRGPKSDDPTPL